MYAPPEWWRDHCYKADNLSVWELGEPEKPLQTHQNKKNIPIGSFTLVRPAAVRHAVWGAPLPIYG